MLGRPRRLRRRPPTRAPMERDPRLQRGRRPQRQVLARELDGALEQLPSDLDEYTDCRSVIRRAQLGAAGGKHAARSARVVRTGSTDRAAERHEEQRDRATRAGSREHVRIGGAGRAAGRSGAPFDPPASAPTCRRWSLIVLLARGCARCRRCRSAAGARRSDEGAAAPDRRRSQAWNLTLPPLGPREVSAVRGGRAVRAALRLGDRASRSASRSPALWPRPPSSPTAAFSSAPRRWWRWR